MDTFQTWTFAIIDVAFSLTFSDDGEEAGGKEEAGSGVIHSILCQMWDFMGAKRDSPHNPLSAHNLKGRERDAN